MKNQLYLILCIMILLFAGCSRTENMADRESEKPLDNKTKICTSTPVPTTTATLIPRPTKKSTKKVKMLVSQTVHSFSGDKMTEYAYDNKGRVIGIIETDSKGKVVRETYNEYDKQERLSTVTAKDASGTTTTTTYTYDEQSAIVKTEKTFADGSISVDRAFEEYDENGNLIFRRDSIKEVICRYDTKSRLIEESTVRIETPFTKRRTVYEYEGESDIYSRVSVYENDDKKAKHVTEYTYIQEGNHGETTMLYETGLCDRVSNDFDEDGDCIKSRMGSVWEGDSIEWYIEYTYQYDYVEVDND